MKDDILIILAEVSLHEKDIETAQQELLDLFLVSFSLPTQKEMEDKTYEVGQEYEGDYPDCVEEGFEMCYDWIKKSNES